LVLTVDQEVGGPNPPSCTKHLTHPVPNPLGAGLLVDPIGEQRTAPLLSVTNAPREVGLGQGHAEQINATFRHVGVSAVSSDASIDILMRVHPEMIHLGRCRIGIHGRGMVAALTTGHH
jgi:hypothetical protein